MKNSIGKEFNFFSLLKFALPTIIMMIITSLYTIVDSMFVSRYVGTNALSALNIAYPAINIVMAISIMLSTGGSAVIARKMGSGKTKEARKNLSLIYLSGFIVSITIAIIGITFINKLIRLLGASDILFDYAKDYLTILLIFAPFLVIQMLCQTFLVVAGNPTLGLTISIVSGIVNCVLDYTFIAVLDLGIVGAALGTGIGYVIGAVWGVLYLCRKKNTLHFEKPTFDLKVLAESCFNGSSEMVSNIAMAVVTLLFNLTMMKFLGEDGVAAITIMLYAEFILNALFMGFSMGVAPVISYHYGSENPVQIKKIIKICVVFIVICAMLAFCSALLITPILIQIFTPIGSSVYNIAIGGFAIFSLGFLFSGMNIFASAMFTAFSNGKISALISFLRTFVFIVAGLLILPQFFAVKGIWFALPVAEFLTMLLSVTLIIRYRNQYRYGS